MSALRSSIALSSVVSLVVFAQPGTLPVCPVPDGDCFGEVKYSTGDRYLGEMRQFKMHGLGATFGADGSVKQAGTWADGKLVTAASVDFQPYVAEYPKFKAQLLEAVATLDRKREQELVQSYLEKEPATLGWSTRVERAITNATRDWIDGPAAAEEAPMAELAPLAKLTRESWESNKEFEVRVAASKAAYQKEVAKRQASESRKAVAAKQASAQRALRSKRLPQVKLAFTQRALSLLDLKITQESANFDPARAVLSVELAIDGAPAERFDFHDAPLELRKRALGGPDGVSYQVRFFVTKSGQYGLEAIKAEAGGVTASGVSAKRR